VQRGGDHLLAGVAPAAKLLDLIDKRPDRMNNLMNAYI
jgi:hypothetical protein